MVPLAYYAMPSPKRTSLPCPTAAAKSAIGMQRPCSSSPNFEKRSVLCTLGVSFALSVSASRAFAILSFVPSTYTRSWSGELRCPFNLVQEVVLPNFLPFFFTVLAWCCSGLVTAWLLVCKPFDFVLVFNLAGFHLLPLSCWLLGQPRSCGGRMGRSSCERLTCCLFVRRLSLGRVWGRAFPCLIILCREVFAETTVSREMDCISSTGGSYGMASSYATTSFNSNEQKTTCSTRSPSGPVKKDLTSEMAASAASALGYP